MTTDTPSTDEPPKPSAASIDDPSAEKQNEPKPTNDDANKQVEDPTPGPADPVQGETKSGESAVEKPTVGEETKEHQVAGETAVQTIGTSGASALAAMKANKKNQKKIDSSNIIKTPNVHDVLLGRGKPFQNHDGNQSMLRIVDMYRKRYHESERAFKHEIIEEVLDIIKSKGGRFLERIDDFDKSFWNQVPHRMAYRKVGHAFRSNARRISMEKRDQAHNQRRNASAMARASMMSQLINGNDGIMQRMPLQGVSLAPEMMAMGGRMKLADAMGIGGSVYNDGNMFRQGGAGAGLNQTQRELLAQEQMLHSSRIERILGNNVPGAPAPGRFDGMLGAGGADPLSLAAMGAGGNLAGRSLQQIDNMRRMMLLGGSGSVPNHAAAAGAAYHFANPAAAAGLSNMGNVGDAATSAFK